jgi:hypothetical protein
MFFSERGTCRARRQLARWGAKRDVESLLPYVIPLLARVSVPRGKKKLRSTPVPFRESLEREDHTSISDVIFFIYLTVLKISIWLLVHRVKRKRSYQLARRKRVGAKPPIPSGAQRRISSRS